MSKEEKDPVCYFYENPSVERALVLVERLARGTLGRLTIDKRDGQATLAYLQKRFPESAKRFASVVSRIVPKQKRRFVQLATMMSGESKGSLDLEHHWECTPLWLDIIWCGFMITGSVSYINRIIDSLERGDGDAVYRGTLMWSLENNAVHHKPVYGEILKRVLVAKSTNQHLLTMNQRIKKAITADK